MLEESNFSSEDYLFVLGDLFEKSDTNIEFLDYFMEFHHNNPNVFVISGNCDNVLRGLIPPVNREIFLKYALKIKHSIINNMASITGDVITYDTDCDLLCSKFLKEFKKYYDYVDSLPDVIIINSDIMLVHAGIDDYSLIPLTPESINKKDAFYLNHKTPMRHLTIVGHYPTINYNKSLPILDPIIDLDKNIISIDGGNNVRIGGQLNLLVMENIVNRKFSFLRIDNYPNKMICEDVVGSDDVFNLTFKKWELEIINREEDYVYCNVKELNKKLYVHNEDIYISNKCYYCVEGFNNFFKLVNGEMVKIVRKANPYTLVKKDGVLGLVKTSAIYWG